MNKHDWVKGKCSLCKVIKFISNGLDTEEKHKNRGFAEASFPQAYGTFYMLNDGRYSITDVLPECMGECEEILPEHEYIQYEDGTAILSLK